MKAKAVLEVVVVFGLTLLFIVMIGLSPIGEWERQVIGNFYFIEYAVMIAFPLLILLVTRRDLASYGLSVSNFRYHLGIAAVGFIPVALASIPLIFVDEKRWLGGLVMAAVEIALLFLLAWTLRRRPTRNESGLMLSSVLLIAGSNLVQKGTLAYAVMTFVYYLFFVGLGEELLFRGSIQSRLNLAWGRPFRFFGVNWGWGIIIASALFGLMHVLNTGSLIAGHWQFTPGWGLWTFLAGLALGFVREKTGSIVASTILHGLPQAIFTALPMPG